MAECISVGLVGAGWVAEHGYVPALRKSRFRPAAVYDPDPSRAARIAEMLGTDVALSLEACVSKSGRAVILCSPPHVHADQIRLCLSAGRFVLCEKPVLREARELRQIGPPGAATSRLMGSATTRLRPDVELLLSWVRARRIGHLRRLRLGWWRERGVPRPGSWRTDASLCPDGAFEDLAPHLLDIAAAALPDAPASPARVSASFERRHGSADRVARWFDGASGCAYSAPDSGRAVLETPAGVVIEIETCWTCDTPGDLSTVCFEGTRGTAHLRGLFGFSMTRRLSEQACALKIDGDIVDRRLFPPGPSVQRMAFGTSLERFARFCDGEESGAAGYPEIAQVTLWMQAIRDAARDAHGIDRHADMREMRAV